MEETGPPEDDDPLEFLDAREAARDRRRDHDLHAEGRDLMRPGTGKVFKQILDHQVREANEPRPKGHRPRS
ncbi:MAG: hypothetical protein MUQ32_15525 [Chloroflexi bacterium]|nr:hypothetical protein [Chloroflexota bacterium]